jgi:hypothetical protein
VLYENERGGFLCGIPLFSSKALGNLDPPAWTNAFHKPSPTNIKTAQVPDPAWEWAWPEWRVNRDETIDTDEGGWEYSFMFSKKFSWHGPKWWNSFVRRRAWIRKRLRRKTRVVSADPHMLNTEYFNVRPASQASQSPSRAGSRLGSRGGSGSLLSRSDAGNDTDKPEIEDIETLIVTLRRSRIDREKLDAVENYLAHVEDDDLVHLQAEMHEIMKVFVFQASRRILLSRLKQVHEEAIKLKEEGEGDSQALKLRIKHLAAAVEHADEEVRKLAYWSDVKLMSNEDEDQKPTENGGNGYK